MSGFHKHTLAAGAGGVAVVPPLEFFVLEQALNSIKPKTATAKALYLLLFFMFFPPLMSFEALSDVNKRYSKVRARLYKIYTVFESIIWYLGGPKTALSKVSGLSETLSHA